MTGTPDDGRRLSSVRLRPHFELRLECQPARILEAIGDRMDRPDAEFTGAVFSSSAVLKILPDQQHYWSPQLQIGVERDGAETVVRGLFGPRPAVWTLFVALYAAVAFVGAMGGVFGLSLMTLGRPAHLLWSLPGAALMIVAIYAMAMVGQRLGSEQMDLLRTEFDRAIMDCGNVSEGQ